MEYPSCDEVIKMRNVKTFVVEIRGMIPINPDFVDDFDGFLADLIESFCAIDPVCLQCALKIHIPTQEILAYSAQTVF